MTHKDDDMQKLERVLKEAHRSRQGPLLGPVWTRSVMRNIRHAATRAEGGTVIPGVEQLVWRTAAVAAAVVAVLTVSIVAGSWTGASDSAGALAEEFELAAVFPE